MRVTPRSKVQAIPAIFYGATTTESLVPWEWLDKSRGKFSMTEWERAETLLRAVNGKPLKVREWMRLCGAPLTGSAFKFQGDGLDEAWMPLVEIARAPLQAALEAVIRDPHAAVPEIGKNSAEILDGRLIRVPEHAGDGTLRDRVIAYNIGAALIFTLTLVIDPGKPFRKRLRQCAHCGRFALGKPRETRGKPPNFFCPGTTHQADYIKQQQNRRKARQRRRHK